MSPTHPITPPACQDLLGLLYRRSLLEWDEAKQRYRLHDLVRAFGAARLADTGAVWQRYARYYAQIARKANDLYLQGGAAVLTGLALFDAERAHIDGGWQWAIGQAGHPDGDELLLAYADALHAMADLRYHLRRERIPHLEAQLAAAQRLDRRDHQGYALGNLGLAYTELGETRRAIEYHEQALEISRAIGDRHAEGQDLGNLGLAYAGLGEVRRAIEFYEQRIVIACEVGDRRGESTALGNLGNAYKILSEARRAIEYHEQALAIAREIGDRDGEARHLFNIGLVLDSLGRRAEAIAQAEAALSIYEQIESPWAERVRQQLAAWRAQPAASAARKPRKRRGRKTRDE
jgi:tetratricopeptide (TPR) repeat protein